MISARHVWLAAFAALVLVAWPAANQAARPSQLKNQSADQPTRAEEALDRALNGPVAEPPAPMPLEYFVEYLQAEYQIEARLDEKAVPKPLARSLPQVALNVEGVRLRTSLELALRPLELTWTICDGVLLITTPEEAEALLVVRVYDVEDLVRRGNPNQDDYHSLIDLITSTISPTYWDEVGGPGAIQPFRRANRPVLVVSQTPQTHEQIAELFAALRGVGGDRDRDVYRPRVAPTSGQTASAPRSATTPSGRRRARVYQAAAWAKPELHP